MEMEVNLQQSRAKKRKPWRCSVRVKSSFVDVRSKETN